MNSASYTVNQFALVDEKNTALKDLLSELEWQGEDLLRLSLPILPMIEAVASLESRASLDNLRTNLVTELKNLKIRGRDLNVAPALLDKLCFIWAAYFDECVSYECELDTTQWQNNTLVSQLFGVRNSGETFFNLLKQLMEYPKKHLALIKICYLILQLGFKGKFNTQQQGQLNKIIADVHFAINELHGFETNTSSRYSIKPSKTSSRFGLFKGVSPIFFWPFVALLLVGGLFYYNHYVGEIYEKQNYEYQEMADDTFRHIKKLQPKPIYIENTDYLTQQYYQSEAVVNKTIEQSTASDANNENQASDIVTQYLVQLGAFYDLQRAQALQAKCADSQYKTTIEYSGGRHRVALVASGYQQAKRIGEYFSKHCNTEAYIREYL